MHNAISFLQHDKSHLNDFSIRYFNFALLIERYIKQGHDIIEKYYC